MNPLANILFLYSSLVIVNCIISTLLWISSKSELYKKLSLVWLFTFLVWVIQGYTATLSNFYKLIGFSSAHFANVMFSLLLGSVAGFLIEWKNYLYILSLGYLGFASLSYFGAAPHLIALPITIAVGFPLLYGGYRAITFKRSYSLSVWGLIVTSIAFGFFTLSYGFVYDQSELAMTGYTISFLFIFLLTCFAPASVIESVTNENTRLNMEKQYQAAITNSATFSALGEMAGGIAHEINNPLAIIQLTAEQMAHDLRQDVQQGSQNDRSKTLSRCESQIARIIQSSKRAAKIIENLRLISRDASQDPFTNTPVNQILEQLLLLCHQSLQDKKIELRLNSPPPHLTAYCRPLEIEQVLLKLIQNAVDAVLPCSSKWIELAVKEEPKQIILSITDSGCGIPDGVKNRLFQPFVTSKDVGKGTGLNLSISRRIIENNGGQLYLDEASPHTRFIFSLKKPA